MSSRKVRLGDFLIRSKIPVDIEDNKQYKRVTIRTKHQGVSVRDVEIGSKIGTKKQFILKAGQFVLSKIDAMYGAFGIAPDEVDGAIITGNFWAYDYDKNMVSIEWLNHFTNSPDFYDLCRRASTGITHRKYLDEDLFLSYEVNLPDLEEQKKIVASIDSIKEKVSLIEAELTHQLTLISRLEQAILQEAVQGKLVPQDPNDEPASELLKRIKAERQKSLPAGAKRRQENPLPPIKPEDLPAGKAGIPFDIPENWVWCRLGEICERIHYGFNASAKPNNTGVRLLRITDIQENKVDWDTVPGCDYSENDLENYLLNENDIVIARTGGTIGKTFLVKNIPVKALFASYLIRAIPSNAVFPDYAKSFMESPIYWKQLYDAAGGAAQPNVNGTSLSNLLFPLPPFPSKNALWQK